MVAQNLVFTIVSPQTIVIGDTAVESLPDSGNANLLCCNPVTLGQAATLQSITLDITAAAGNLVMGLYDATGISNGPGNLLATTAQFVPAVGMHAQPVLTPTALSSGNYWLAYLPSANGLSFLKQSNTGPGIAYSRTFGALPTSVAGLTVADAAASIWTFYATLTSSISSGSSGSSGTAVVGDGSSGAPAGAAQFPTLFTTDAAPGSYAARPPWLVAGVDYHVGVDKTLYPTLASMKNPATATLPAGVTRSGTTINITGTNVVFDGYDMTVGGTQEWDIFDLGTSTIVSNCYFVVKTKSCYGNNDNPGSLTAHAATNPTITKCEIHMSGTGYRGQGQWGSNHRGTCTVTYCWLDQSWAENFNASDDFGGAVWTFKWNLITNAGVGFPVDGTHGDLMMIYNVGINSAEVDYLYNTCIQNVSLNSARCQGLSTFSAGGNSGYVATVKFQNNTMVAHQPGVTDVPNSIGAYVNFGILVDWFWVQQNGSLVAYNYFDPIGMDDPIWGGPHYNTHPSGQPWGMPTITNNINMRTGNTITTWADQWTSSVT